MKIHEYQGKELLRKYGVTVPRGVFCASVDEAVKAAETLGGKVWVYQTQFRGSPWYVVLQGDHASLEQARAAIRTLPPALLKEQPWPKSFAQVKKELKK